MKTFSCQIKLFYHGEKFLPTYPEKNKGSNSQEQNNLCAKITFTTPLIQGRAVARRVAPCRWACGDRGSRITITVMIAARSGLADTLCRSRSLGLSSWDVARSGGVRVCDYGLCLVGERRGCAGRFSGVR